MKCSANIKNERNQHKAIVRTNDVQKEVKIPSKSSGYGSSVNGGELLMLSLATCYCNDLYREAAKRNLTISEVDVTVTGDFGAAGEAGSNFKYKVSVKSDESADKIESLIVQTDQLAEIHNTLRKGVNVTLVR